MDTPFKLHIKLGQVEFNAEGPEKTVKEAYEQFLKANAAISTESKKEKPTGSGDKNESANVESSLLQRIYASDPKKEIVSLRLLPSDGPNRVSDAAILILYGCQLLLNKTEVPVTKLMTGLRQSGLPVDRLDHIMSVYSQNVIKGGRKSGGRYALNNQGIVQAKVLLRQFH